MIREKQNKALNKIWKWTYNSTKNIKIFYIKLFIQIKKWNFKGFIKKNKILNKTFKEFI